MKVSIITVTYNAEKTVEETIHSVLDQTYSPIEYIIIDGNSDDNTRNIITRFKDKISVFISEEDHGIYDAMNKGLKLATGDIVGILNADDIYAYNEVISDVAACFEKDKCDVLFGNLYMYDSTLSKLIRVWKSSPYKKHGFLKGWHPPHPTFFVKRKIYEAYGYFDASLDISADFELMLRFIEKNGVKASYLDKFLVKMRLGGASTHSVANILEGHRNIKKAFRKNSIQIPNLYFLKRVINKLRQYHAKR